MSKTKAFGAETSFNSADLILIPVPWEATVSYGEGASQGPDLIRTASFQMDFFNPQLKARYNHKIHFLSSDPLVISLNKSACSWARTAQKSSVSSQKVLIKKVNQASQSLLDWLYETCSRTCRKGKIPAVAGGDHSVSEGLIRCIGESLKGNFGLLHIDAHADLRKSYQGFEHSHASVMRNILCLPQAPKKLVQVGVRDLCEEEYRFIEKEKRVKCYFDADLSDRLFSGESWRGICARIIGDLPSPIHISLDMDGLSWSYAPGTGTPVPGGLSFSQLICLFLEIKRQNKKLVSFDIVETACKGKNDPFREWNGNVAARLIYFLSGLALEGQNS